MITSLLDINALTGVVEDAAMAVRGLYSEFKNVLSQDGIGRFDQLSDGAASKFKEALRNSLIGRLEGELNSEQIGALHAVIRLQIDRTYEYLLMCDG